MKEGLFISFEGGEGAGKTTLIQGLKSLLEQEGHQVVATREPGGTKLGKEVRHWLLDSHEKVAVRAELLLFLADRAQHVTELILPNLQQGKVILCDRFTDSTLAYQGVARGLGIDEMLPLCAFATGGLEPHLTFYLDLDPTVGLGRIVGRGVQDRMEKEKLQFHQRIRDAFLSLAKQHSQRIKVIDAMQSIEAVLKEVHHYIRENIHAKLSL